MARILSEATYQRLQDAADYIESHQGQPPRRRLRSPGTSNIEPITVRCTSGTPNSDGLYPGMITRWEPDSATWTDFAAVNLLPANGETLVSGTRYATMPVGTRSSVDVYQVLQGVNTTGTAPTVDNSTADGRLTLLSGSPVPVADQSAAGALYYTPFIGNQVALYNGTAWALFTLTERSLSLTVTSGKNYDVFLFSNSGTLTLELSAAWTNDTTRADALVRQDGAWVKSADHTRRWLGTIRATGANQVSDTSTQRFVFNAQNRVPRPLSKVNNAGIHTYQVNAWRQVGSMQFEVVVGEDGAEVSASGSISTYNTSGSGNRQIGFGVDSTTALAIGAVTGDTGLQSATSNDYVNMCCFLDQALAAGYHTITWLEFGSAVGVNTFNNTGGIVGRIIG